MTALLEAASAEPAPADPQRIFISILPRVRE
jgi:hypothetical protein